MRTCTAKRISGPFATLSKGIFLGLALMMATQAEARPVDDRTSQLWALQWHLVDRMTQTTVMTVLGHGTEKEVSEIEDARAQFDRTLRGLRRGDDELGLKPTSDPEVLNRISRVELVWLRYDAALQAIIAELYSAPEVDVAFMEALFDLHVEIIATIDQTTEALRQAPSRTTTAYRQDVSLTIR